METKEKLRALTQSPCMITVISDAETYVPALVRYVIEKRFPKATVLVFDSVDYLHTEETIEIQKPDVCIIDGSLTSWPAHPRFGQEGYKLIAYLRETYPDMIIISMSLNDWLNNQALKNGADYAFLKNDMHEEFKALL